MMSNFSRILKWVTSDTYENYKNDPEFESLLKKEHLHLEQYPAGTMLIHFGNPIHSICVLLDGLCCTEKYNIQGRLLISENITPVEFFGLFEAVNPLPLLHHEVSIRCITSCTCLKIPIRRYLKELESNTDALQISLRSLSKFIHRILLQNDGLILNNARCNILSKLLECSQGKVFPFVLPLKKEELAQTLNISLRTLYRKLDALYEEGLISSQRGKILITREQYDRISSALQKELLEGTSSGK